MNRVLIIGNAGSGKTTFAKKLAEKTSLPLVHLDRLYWHGSWEHLERDAFDAVLQAQLDKPRWIIDGNFNRTLPHRLQYCDTVFFFDLPVASCVTGITKRLLANYRKTRDDMGGNCEERLGKNTLSLYRNVLHFNRQHRKDYHALLSQQSHIKVVVFNNHRQAKAFLQGLHDIELI